MGPYFDDFVNISIFMIWGVFGGSLARWDSCPMNGIFVLCIGYFSYVWGICLMYGVFVLCMGYLSYVWDICLMYGVFVLCMG